MGEGNVLTPVILFTGEGVPSQKGWDRSVWSEAGWVSGQGDGAWSGGCLVRGVSHFSKGWSPIFQTGGSPIFVKIGAPPPTPTEPFHVLCQFLTLPIQEYCQCAVGTHPTGMHTCFDSMFEYVVGFMLGKTFYLNSFALLLIGQSPQGDRNARRNVYWPTYKLYRR